MLSDKDLLKVLGNELIIYPLNIKNIQGGSVFINSSSLAWSRKTKENIVQKDKLLIPANDTAIIVSEELLYLSTKYCGTCHARVLHVASGLGHISTVIKPGSKGRLLISIHNTTDATVEISTEGIAVVTFHKLDSKAKRPFTEERSGPSAIKDLGIELTEEDKNLLESPYCRGLDDLRHVFKSSDNYKEYLTINRKQFLTPYRAAVIMSVVMAVLLITPFTGIFPEMKPDISTIPICLATILSGLSGYFFSKQ